jgi:hypothetical protein
VSGFWDLEDSSIMRAPAGLLALVMGVALATAARADEGWISLFDGKSLDGWKVSENKDSVRVEDGKIVLNGPRAHAFYDGPVNNHDFKNFELRVEVMTLPNSNAGIYFHTQYQDTGWPEKGYEVQVNNTHKDPKKTGGLYAVVDVFEAPAKDNEWFVEHIKVDGKRIVILVDGKQTVDYTEPENPERPQAMAGRRLSSGTFALQAHDPGSTVYIRKVEVRPLP